MKVITCLSILLAALLMTATLVAEEPVEKPTAPHFTKIDDAFASAVTNDRSILLDFYATW